MKRVIVLKDGGGRMANKLWNAASIYGYCLEKNCEYYNYSFFRYQHYFNIGGCDLFCRFYQWHKNYRISQVLYRIYAEVVCFFCSRRVIKDDGSKFLLPPSLSGNYDQRLYVDLLNDNEQDTFYFVGWLFRNPIGLKKYYNEIKKYFRPKEIYYSEILKLKATLKEKYKLIVGVHIRQGDYKTWQGGKHYFADSDVKKILDDFVGSHSKFKKEEIVFVICSDGPVDASVFSGLNIIKGLGSEITDLYMLAETDLIIGSNSTYGTWAAYYGQIPFYLFSKEKIDWNIKRIPN